MLRPRRRLISVKKRGSAGSYGSPVRFRRPKRRISRSVQGLVCMAPTAGYNVTDVERLCRRRRSAPLAWSDVPPGMPSFALLCDDPDAPSGTWRHGRSTTFPPTAPSLPKTPTAAPPGDFELAIEFRRPDSGGPCPPPRHGPHHYHFRLLALSVASLPLRGRPTCKDVERKARKHVLAEAALVGVHQR